MPQKANKTERADSFQSGELNDNLREPVGFGGPDPTRLGMGQAQRDRARAEEAVKNRRRKRPVRSKV